MEFPNSHTTHSLAVLKPPLVKSHWICALRTQRRIPTRIHGTSCRPRLIKSMRRTEACKRLSWSFVLSHLFTSHGWNMGGRWQDGPGGNRWHWDPEKAHNKLGGMAWLRPMAGCLMMLQSARARGKTLPLLGYLGVALLNNCPPDDLDTFWQSLVDLLESQDGQQAQMAVNNLILSEQNLLPERLSYALRSCPWLVHQHGLRPIAPGAVGLAGAVIQLLNEHWMLSVIEHDLT